MATRDMQKSTACVCLIALLCAALACGPSEKKGEAPSRGAQPPAPAVAGPANKAGKPSLLLITIDTWRWDYVGASDSGRVATPNLDRLAREGVYEPECETPCPLTTPAHSSLLTGLLPLHHGVLDCISYALPARVPTLAEAFLGKGFTTAAFVSSLSLDKRYGLAHGFRTYDEGSMVNARGANPDRPERDGGETTDAARGYLSSQPSSVPLFVWIHYYDLHMPYRKRPSLEAAYPGRPYAAQAAFVDSEVGKLLEALGADKGRAWRIVIVGDHGEGLGDHHEMGHGTALYRSTLHVPLIIWPKPERALAHAKPWRLEDLAPTVRQWFALPAQAGDGQSLFAGEGAARFLASLTIQPSIQYGVNPCLGMRRGPLMYIRHGLEELYDLSADPEEARDLSRDQARKRDLEELRAACNEAFPPERLQAAASAAIQTQDADLNALRGLGYVGGFVPALKELQRADIQKVCEDEAAFYAAEDAYKRDRAASPMKQAYESLLASYPRAALFYQKFGIFLLSQDDREGAAIAFERAVKLNPRDTTSLVNLAGLELAAGKVERAKALYEAVLALDANDPVAHKNLGIIYQGFLKDPAQAVAHYKRYLELGPDADEDMIRKYIQDQEGKPPGPAR